MLTSAAMARILPAAIRCLLQRRFAILQPAECGVHLLVGNALLQTAA